MAGVGAVTNVWAFLVVVFIFGPTVDCVQPSRYKTWWAKKITNDFYTAGRLSARELKYAYEAGFNSVVSMFNFTEPDNVTQDGTYYPTGDQSMKIAEQLNKTFVPVLQLEDDWTSAATVEKFYNVTRDLQRPVLAHCIMAFSSTFHTSLYLLMTGQGGEKVKSVSDVFDIGAKLGFDFAGLFPALVGVAEKYSGQVVTVPPSPSFSPFGWEEKYWQLKPVGGSVFAAGQIWGSHLPKMKDMGVKSIINVRKPPLTSPDLKTQSEVTLLNIKPNTGTYGPDGAPLRQTTAELEATRLIPTISPDYIYAGSEVNYEAENAVEFGDVIGYNETIESQAIASGLPGVQYYNLPINPTARPSADMTEWYLDKATFEAVKDTLVKAVTKEGPTVFHCRAGRAALPWALLAVGHTQGLSSEWALERATFLGYDYQDNKAAIKLFQDVLGTKPTNNSGPTIHAPWRSFMAYTILAWSAIIMVIIQ